MDVRIETLPTLRLAGMRHVGPYGEVGPYFEEMMAWAGQAGLFGPSTRVVGLSYDAPSITKPERLRYDICVTVERDIETPKGIRLFDLPGGEWAMVRVTGPYDQIPGAFEHLIFEWMPQNGRWFDLRPGMEIYLNGGPEVAPQDHITDICVPLEPVIELAG